MSTARSSIVTSRRRPDTRRTRRPASPIAVCENSTGALIRSRRADALPEAISAAVWSISVSSARSFGERPPLLGQLQRARAPLEQAQIKARLQLCDAAGQGRLWTAGGPGGSAEAAMAGDQVEIGEGEKIHVFHQ